MSFQTLALKTADGVATLTLDRPQAMNALTAAMKAELAAALDALESDENVRAIVITGAGQRAFCAGADIKERSATAPTPAQFLATQAGTQALFRRLEQCGKPTIAALNGAALGGGLELALCCDIRWAADHAVLGLPELALGVIPAGGGTQRLARVIGASRTKQMLFTAARVTAPDALELGLVSRVVPREELRDAVRALASDIAAKPPLAVRFAKRVVDAGMQTDIDRALEFEMWAASILFDTNDRREGMQAFLEKRSPRFEGR